MNTKTILTLIDNAIDFKSKSLAEQAIDAIDELLAKSSTFRESDRRRDRAGRWTSGGPGVGMGWEVITPAVTEKYQVFVKDKVTGRRKKRDRVRILVPEVGRWVDEKGKPVSKANLKQIEDLGIPKTLIGVKINPDKGGKTAAIGYNRNPVTGEIRKGYTSIMNEDELVVSYKAKWEALGKFDKVKKVLEKKAYTDALDGLPQAQALFVIDQMGIRVGEGKAKRQTGTTRTGLKTYGCVDLLARHVKVRGNTVHFKFLEKGGKVYDRKVQGAKLASVIKVALQDSFGNDKKGEDRLFQTTQETVSRYMKLNGGPDTAKHKMTPHSYRYWWATAHAAMHVKREGLPASKKRANEIKKAAVLAAAEFLNDKPSTVYETYINPIVWADWGDDIAPAPPKLNRKSLNLSPSRAQAAMDELLNEHSFIFPDFGDDEIKPEDIDSFDEDEPFEGVSWQKDVLDK